MTDTSWTWRQSLRWWLRRQSKWVTHNHEKRLGRRWANTAARPPWRAPSWSWRVQQALSRPRTPLWHERALRREREEWLQRRAERRTRTGSHPMFDDDVKESAR